MASHFNLQISLYMCITSLPYLYMCSVSQAYRYAVTYPSLLRLTLACCDLPYLACCDLP